MGTIIPWQEKPIGGPSEEEPPTSYNLEVTIALEVASVELQSAC